MRPDAGALRYFGRIKNGTTPSSEEAEYWNGEVKWATPEDLGRLAGDRIADTKRKVTEKAVFETNLSVLPIGSVLISTRAPIGHMAITSEPMAFNQGCRGVIPNDRTHSPFLYYLLKSRVPELNAMANGTTFLELSRDELAAVYLKFPPIEIQKRIALFLDEKTARIDGLIKKKLALLDRLSEKRQATIAQIVTKGLDPSVAMKPSGVDWLGDIPTHWDCGNIRRFAQMKTGHTPSRSSPEYWDDCTIPWFTLADVWQLRDGTRWYLEETAENISEIGLANSAAELLPAGTVVFSRTASVGYSGIMPSPMATSQDFWNWICGPKLLPEYLLLLFRSMTQKFEESTSGSTHKTIYQGIAAGLKICVAPLPEQRSIAEYVFSRTIGIDEAALKIRCSINGLTHYRAALIASAVTGQIAELQ
jgi:type I restriction enzyme S subunit